MSGRVQAELAPVRCWSDRKDVLLCGVRRDVRPQRQIRTRRPLLRRSTLPRSGEETLDQITIETAVLAEAGGWASQEDVELLAKDKLAWIATLRRLIHETDGAFTSAYALDGDLRSIVLTDLSAERDRLSEALERAGGDPVPSPNSVAPAVQERIEQPDRATSGVSEALEPVQAEHAEPPTLLVGVPRLQVSWGEARVVVWAGGPGCECGPEDLDRFLANTEASTIAWETHGPVTHAFTGSTPARAATLSQTLGWLVGIGAGRGGDDVAPSLRWLAEVAIWGAELVASGHMVPLLRAASASQTSAKSGPGRYRVRWFPALVSRERLHDMVTRMPGAISALQPATAPDALTRSILGSVVDAVARAGASRLESPAASPVASSRPEVGEAFIYGLDGKPFAADNDPALRSADDLKRWASAVTTSVRVGLLIRLDPPGDDGGWLLNVEATGVDKRPMAVEPAMVITSGAKSHQLEAQLRRVERLVPALKRPTTRRGQVLLDSEEAARIMFETGPSLVGAGFEVMLPLVSRRRPSPQLRLYAEAAAGTSQVGVSQLANVRWSVLFGDLELTAAEISRLAKEASPLVKVRGRWVHLDRDELAAASAALAERASITQMSGAEMIRHAVGIEGGTLAGPLRVEGTGWAADLLRGATTHPPAPIDTPDGFAGQLRSYQAEAGGWLGFLDRAGLGGCLAMDMGLGKTPTVLAHMIADKGHGPSLVICPPAVLGNWYAEARRFTPRLSVALHHGPRRAEADGIAKLASGHDVVLTTYATAVRDIEALSAVTWRRVVVDEAQVIKNHTNETARELRRLKAHSKLALTGTPVENGLGDLWAILDWTNPGLVGGRTAFIESLSRSTGAAAGGVVDGGADRADEAGRPSERVAGSWVTGSGGGGSVGAGGPTSGLRTPSGVPAARSAQESALRALNGLLIFRRTKNEPEIAAELPDKVDRLDHCAMTAEQIGLYQAVVNRLVESDLDGDANKRKGQVLAAITALKQICDHPAAYLGEQDELPGLDDRSGKLTRLEEIFDDVIAGGERLLVFTHFARWGERLASHLSARSGIDIGCYHGGLTRVARDELVAKFQAGTGPGALVLSIKAGGSGLNLTAARHVVLYDRWWNPAVEDQARDRAWRIGQEGTVMCHRLVCPGTVDERVEEIVAGKRRIAGMVLPTRSSLGDLDAGQLRVALGLREEDLVEDEPGLEGGGEERAA